MSSEDTWIIVRNWNRFQHYGERRNPIFIKNYTELLSDQAYLGLTLHQRGVLHGIWLEYAAARRQLPGSTLSLTRRLGHRVSTRDIDSLVQAGFIELSASKLLAQSRESASTSRAREEKEKETPPTPPNRGDMNGTSKLTKRQLSRYTGCRQTRGTHSGGYTHDPLGQAKPPPGWPHPKPTPDEIYAALAALD